MTTNKKPPKPKPLPTRSRRKPGSRDIPDPLRARAKEYAHDRMVLNAEAKRVFLRLFEQYGQKALAAEGAGVTLRQVATQLKEDAAFAERVEAALERFRDRLEVEAHRRATEGVEEPVYQRGALVGTVTRYSDSLLLALLRRHRKVEYSDKAELDVTMKGGVLVTPGPATSAEDWAAAHAGAGAPPKDE